MPDTIAVGTIATDRAEAGSTTNDPLRAVLARDGVVLEPFVPAHTEPLRAACAEDRTIWKVYPYSMVDEHFDAAITLRVATPGVFFVVLVEGEVVGTTMYLLSLIHI